MDQTNADAESTAETHSPEPWIPTGDGLAVVDANGNLVISPQPHPVQATTPERRWTNRNRILACVNACAGIPTIALETGAVAVMHDAIVRFRDMVRTDGRVLGWNSADLDWLNAVVAHAEGGPVPKTMGQE